MKITPDTNVLVRAAMDDDPDQSRTAKTVLQNAEIIALALPALCEFVWVMSRGYKIAPAQISDAIRRLMDGQNIVAHRAAVEAGLKMLDSGGDFAEGVIAYEGRWLGGEVFVSFDRRAVKLLTAQGRETQLLAAGSRGAKQ
ncbi:MAG TPA: type II toxin-antitoxin system VapC family toxin [Micropepsaceae bacterium]|nr:type II toxin-antitoxin system VapC family toxin [Micropepsaceae bacterium]